MRVVLSDSFRQPGEIRARILVGAHACWMRNNGSKLDTRCEAAPMDFRFLKNLERYDIGGYEYGSHSYRL